MTKLVCVVEVFNGIVTVEECQATDKCPDNVREATKDELEWWDTDDPNHEDLSEDEFEKRYGIKAKEGAYFLVIDGETIDYRKAYETGSLEMYTRIKDKK